ncbi:MAG: polyketide synthase [Kiritimatiellaeota bacterium]|nr:polyketide synthase [Kiritimatiellota bacterium]
MITGVSCRFAESPDTGAFWRTIMQRRAMFTPLALGGGEGKVRQSSENLADKSVCGAVTTLFDLPFPTHSAQLHDLYAYDPSDQHIQRAMTAGENQDVFFIVQLTIDALRDSGYTVSSLPTDRVSLCLGYVPQFNAASVNWLQHTLFLDQTVEVIHKFFPHADPGQLVGVRAQLSSSLPKPSSYAFMSAFNCSMAAWVAHLLGLAGPSTLLEGGGGSAHQAIQSAMDDLLMRRSDIAIAGSVQPPLNLPMLQGLSGAMTFSRAKRLQPFSRESDGTLPGEGGAVFVLKRLKDALQQNDNIYAIVRSTGIVAASLEHRWKVSLSPRQMERTVGRALRKADLTPDLISYIEAHGGGVPHIDQTELDVLQKVFGERKATSPRVGVGAVKGNVGNTLWAAGAASFLKAVLAIYHRVLPPNVEIEKPYPRLASAKSPLYLLTEARPWVRGGKSAPRRAGVMAVDFTGTSAAAVLEEYRG